MLRRLLDAPPRRHEQRDAALLLVRRCCRKLSSRNSVGSLFTTSHLRRLLRIEVVHLEHVRAVEIAAVERRIDRGRQPDEAAADALAERETELQLRRRLVDLVDDERVVRQDVAVLEPAPRDAGRDDDDVPASASPASLRARG